MFESEVFRKPIHCVEESTCDIVGTFRRSPQSFSAPIVIRRPGNCAPLPAFVTPLGVLRYCFLVRICTVDFILFYATNLGNKDAFQNVIVIFISLMVKLNEVVKLACDFRKLLLT